MKKTILLALVVLMILPSVAARFEYQGTGYHNVENGTIVSYMVDYELQLFKDDQLTFWDKSDESIIKVKLEVPEFDAAVDHVRVWCAYYFYESTQGGRDVLDTILVFNDSNTPQTKFLTYRIKGGEELNCSVTTFWNTTHFQNGNGTGSIAQDYNLVGFYYIIPQWKSNFCYEYRLENWNGEMDYIKVQKQYITTILGFIMDFLRMNFEMWLSMYWVIRILILLFGFSIPLYVFVKLITNLRERFRKK